MRSRAVAQAVPSGYRNFRLAFTQPRVSICAVGPGCASAETYAPRGIAFLALQKTREKFYSLRLQAASFNCDERRKNRSRLIARTCAHNLNSSVGECRTHYFLRVDVYATGVHGLLPGNSGPVRAWRVSTRARRRGGVVPRLVLFARCDCCGARWRGPRAWRRKGQQPATTILPERASAFPHVGSSLFAPPRACSPALRTGRCWVHVRDRFSRRTRSGKRDPAPF